MNPTLLLPLILTLLLPHPATCQQSKCGTAQATWTACGFVNTPIDPSTLNTQSSTTYNPGGVTGSISSDGSSIDFDHTGVIPNPNSIHHKRSPFLSKRQSTQKTYFCCAPSATCVYTKTQPLFTACYDAQTGQYVLNNQTTGVETNKDNLQVVAGVYVDVSSGASSWRRRTSSGFLLWNGMGIYGVMVMVMMVTFFIFC